MTTIHDVRMITLPELGDERGNLAVIEGGGDIPFEIRRVFYIHGSDASVIRGRHANKRSSFVLINITGSSKVKVIDQDANEQVFVLDKAHIGLYLPPMIWKDMYDFSPDSVLLVVSDEHYDDAEYVRDFAEFMR